MKHEGSRNLFRDRGKGLLKICEAFKFILEAYYFMRGLINSSGASRAGITFIKLKSLLRSDAEFIIRASVIFSETPFYQVLS